MIQPHFKHCVIWYTMVTLLPHVVVKSSLTISIKFPMMHCACAWSLCDWYLKYRDMEPTLSGNIGQYPGKIDKNRVYRQVSNIRRTLVFNSIRSLLCSWSIACRRCSNYIFILGLTPGFNILRKDYCKPRRETFKFWDLARLILETLRWGLLS